MLTVAHITWIKVLTVAYRESLRSIHGAVFYLKRVEFFSIERVNMCR